MERHMSSNLMAKCKQFYWGLFPKYDQLDLKVYLAKLRVRNRLSKKMVVSPGGEAVISLTTYGDRVDSVYLTIESIGAGTVRPRRLILWLDKEIVPLRYPDFFGHSCLVNFTNGRIYETLKNIHAGAS
jgi:hypothetical protein